MYGFGFHHDYLVTTTGGGRVLITKKVYDLLALNWNFRKKVR